MPDGDVATVNPFFVPWNTPFAMPPLDRIAPEDFPPAFARAMTEQAAGIQAIAANLDPPSFANSIEALEPSAVAMSNISEIYFNLSASVSDPAFERVAREMAPRLAQHRLAIAAHPGLFARIDVLHRQREALSLAPDQLRLLERLHFDAVQAGARLGDEGRLRLEAISRQLATLCTLFQQNLLHDEANWCLILNRTDLDGLPQWAREAYAQAAQARGAAGGFAVSISRESAETFLTFSSRRDLREQVYRAWTSRGANNGCHDNRPLVIEILKLRAELALLLGYPSFAHLKLAEAMAGSPDAAIALVRKVWAGALPKLADETELIEAMAASDGAAMPLAPWDWRYYAELVRRRHYDFDRVRMASYFELDAMLAAAFDSAHRLFGISFHPVEDLPLYHPDVRAYEVLDAGGMHLGLFLHDPFSRAGKQSGAWMGTYRRQGDHRTPIIVNCCNFSKAKPTLLGLDDVRTLFHEFGHALHGLLSHVRYHFQAGTEVRRDFAEFPSQIFENWMCAPAILAKHARHVETGEPLPEELINGLEAARTFNQGFATLEYVACALFDLEVHLVPPEDIEAAEALFLKKRAIPAAIPLRHRPANFQHLFASDAYASSYYAYLWAEVLAADAFEAFCDAGDLFCPILSSRLKEIFAAGDSRDPMELFAGLRGRPPQTLALMRRRGLSRP